MIRQGGCGAGIRREIGCARLGGRRRIETIIRNLDTSGIIAAGHHRRNANMP